jgi:DNA-binding response OmpR family regulator
MDQIKPKVLIIDDDPFIIEIYVLKFKDSGFEVDSAQDAKTGLQKIKDFKPDVILLDIVMPVTSGLEILLEIKKGEAAKFKIILLTNLGQKEDVEKGIKLGADGYIIKAHFTPSEVVEKVKALLTK